MVVMVWTEMFPKDPLNAQLDAVGTWENLQETGPDRRS